MTTNPTPTIKPALDDLFRFKIGDLVQTKVVLAHIESEVDLNGDARPRRTYFEERRWAAPSPLIVTGRLVEECHGGCQIFYHLGGWEAKKSGGPHIVRVTEMELVPHAEVIEVVGQMAASYTAKLEKLEAERKAKREEKGE